MHDRHLQVIALSGSLRRGSTNTALLHAAARLAPPGVRIGVYEELGYLPLFSPDLEEALPPQAQRLRAAMCASDAILIASPEYAHGVPGAFKNALDWVVGCAELGHKPVLLLNASGRAVHAQAALAEIIVTMNLNLLASVVVPLQRGVDVDGIVGDAEAASLLRQAMTDHLVVPACA